MRVYCTKDHHGQWQLKDICRARHRAEMSYLARYGARPAAVIRCELTEIKPKKKGAK